MKREVKSNKQKEKVIFYYSLLSSSVGRRVLVTRCLPKVKMIIPRVTIMVDAILLVVRH